MLVCYRAKEMSSPVIDESATLNRIRDHRGRLRFLLQDGTPIHHTIINGHEHIFMPLDKCMLSLVEPNPDPSHLTSVIHFNHVVADCALGNMCWATAQQRKDYYAATKDLRGSASYVGYRRTRLLYRMSMRAYRRAQKEYRRFGRVVHLPEYIFPWSQT